MKRAAMRLAAIGATCLYVCQIQVAARPDQPIPVVVSITPQKFFVQRIGGKHVDVQLMVQGGDRPDTYMPGPGQIRRLSSAEIFFFAGIPFERAWRKKLQQNFPGLRLDHCCPNIELIRDAHDEKHHDPHIWMSPRQGRLMAAHIYKTLSELRPELSAELETNHARFARELLQIDRDFAREIEKSRTRVILVAHPSLGYLARDYGLEMVSLEEYGRDIGGGKLLQVIERARKEKLDRIFVQPQFNQRAARVVAKAIGARLISIDPLAEDYLDNMRYISTIITN